MEENLENLLLELIKFPNETEWLEFKLNWFEAKRIGEYISALSNSATVCGRKEAYMIWGVSDNHRIIGTDFNYHKMIKNEPFEHYIARQLMPSLKFSFTEILIDNKRVVFLIIPRAVSVPSNFNEKRFIRIGSSIENLIKYPLREAALWDILKNGPATINNRVSSEQNLTFTKLISYYAYKGVTLNLNTFEQNLKLRTDDGKYNILARLLADENTMTFRATIFRGAKKSDVLLSVKEFGNTCLLYSFDKIIDYADTINLIHANEKNRVVERLEQELFNREAYREAILNCFIHNNWVDGNAPMISIFTDRIEILSHGGIPSDQNYSTFFAGVSKPVNESLSLIFLQLKMSERSGKGVPMVIQVYGEEAYTFGYNTIKVTIPFSKIDIINSDEDEVKKNNKIEDAQKLLLNETENGEQFASKMNLTQKKILMQIIKNPCVTTMQLMNKLQLSKTAIQNNLEFLKSNSLIKRVGANKNGYWKLL